MKVFPKVSVCMITYGQDRFIQKAIECVLNQECNFEIELVVVNDSSPDKTDEIIRSIIINHPKGYLINYIKNKINKGVILNSIFAFQQCTGEYVALCEGDDYWTDKCKLTKQVKFLENNSNYMLCHSNVDIVNEDDTIIKNKFKSWNKNNNVLDYRHSIFMPIAFTCTAVFRNINFTRKLSKNVVSVDWMLWIILTLKGDAKFIDEKMAVYRYGVGVSVDKIWYKDFVYWSLFLIKQFSLNISFKKNMWLLKGAIYYLLIYFSRILNITYFSKIANRFKYSIEK